MQEPYYSLLEAGEVFGDRPTGDDFERQLERSCSTIAEQRESDIFFDRCPADYLSYLVALRQVDAASSWLGQATAAISRLDLIVYVPIETPDRIIAGRSELRRLRRAMDVNLRHLLLEDGWGIGADVLMVEGSVAQRARGVLAALDRFPDDRG